LYKAQLQTTWGSTEIVPKMGVVAEFFLLKALESVLFIYYLFIMKFVLKVQYKNTV